MRSCRASCLAPHPRRASPTHALGHTRRAGVPIFASIDAVDHYGNAVTDDVSGELTLLLYPLRDGQYALDQPPIDAGTARMLGAGNFRSACFG